MKRYVRLNEALSSLVRVDKRTTLAELLPHLKGALADAYTEAGK